MTDNLFPWGSESFARVKNAPQWRNVAIVSERKDKRKQNIKGQGPQCRRSYQYKGSKRYVGFFFFILVIFFLFSKKSAELLEWKRTSVVFIAGHLRWLQQQARFLGGEKSKREREKEKVPEGKSWKKERHIGRKALVWTLMWTFSSLALFLSFCRQASAACLAPKDQAGSTVWSQQSGRRSVQRVYQHLCVVYDLCWWWFPTGRTCPCTARRWSGGTGCLWRTAGREDRLPGCRSGTSAAPPGSTSPCASDCGDSWGFRFSHCFHILCLVMFFFFSFFLFISEVHLSWLLVCFFSPRGGKNCFFG